jgi:hypothetical protein
MNQMYEFGTFRADPAEQLLLHEGQPVALTPKVFETLLILLESDGRLILPIRRAIPSLTTHCARDWPSDWNNRRF